MQMKHNILVVALDVIIKAKGCFFLSLHSIRSTKRLTNMIGKMRRLTNEDQA